MAELSQTMPPFPLPTSDEASALQIAGADSSVVGRQNALSLIGCSPLTGDSTLLASFATSLLTGAAPCAGLVEFSDLWAKA